MPKKEYELGGYVIYVPEEAKINLENKTDTPPKTEYSNRQSNKEDNTIKQLCGGKHGKTND